MQAQASTSVARVGDPICMELSRAQVKLELRMRDYSSCGRKQLRKLCFTHNDLYHRSPNFLLAQTDINYCIHHHVGLPPYVVYSPLQLPHLIGFTVHQF